MVNSASRNSSLFRTSSTLAGVPSSETLTLLSTSLATWLNLCYPEYNTFPEPLVFLFLTAGRLHFHMSRYDPQWYINQCRWDAARRYAITSLWRVWLCVNGWRNLTRRDWLSIRSLMALNWVWLWASVEVAGSDCVRISGYSNTHTRSNFWSLFCFYLPSVAVHRCGSKPRDANTTFTLINIYVHLRFHFYTCELTWVDFIFIIQD